MATVGWEAGVSAAQGQRQLCAQSRSFSVAAALPERGRTFSWSANGSQRPVCGRSALSYPSSMDATGANADTVVEKIDKGALAPRTHKVVRELHRHMPLTEAVQQRALSIFDRGEQSKHGEELVGELWALMANEPIDRQSGLRLTNCLARPDEAVDWQLAEYLVLWAREQRLSEQQIIDAFHTE